MAFDAATKDDPIRDELLGLSAMQLYGTLTTRSCLRQTIESARQLRPILQRRIPDAGRRGSLAFARTELYFGTAKSDGSVVTEEEFRAFVDQVITPRFPDGLTVLKGDGQFRLDDGTVIKEQSFVVILLYASETQKESSRKVEVVRQLYLNMHDQESVLRVDDPFFVWVSF
jgi:hypothetical protein